MGGGNSKEKQRKKVAQEHQQKKAKQAGDKKEKEEKREQSQRTEETPGGGKTTGRFIDPGEGERFYVVHTPPGDDTDRPVLFFLHDSESDAWKAATSETHWCDLADEHKFVVVFPEAMPETDSEDTMHLWNMKNPSTELEFLEAVFKEVKEKHSVDESKAYCCGYSSGGLLSSEVAVAMSDTFAAVCNIMGGISKKDDAGQPEDAKRVIPLWIITGSGDNMKSSCELAKRKYEDAGWTVKYEELADTNHGYLPDKEKEIWEWFSNKE